MTNFIDNIKEKQRQKEIRIKASEAEIKANQSMVPDEKRIASNAQLRYIYRDSNQFNKK